MWQILLLLVVLTQTFGARAHARACFELFRSSEVQDLSEFFGDDFVVRDVQLSQEPAVVSGFESSEGRRQARYLEKVQERIALERLVTSQNVANALEQRLTTNHVKTVLYFASGFDGATPFVVFRHAQNVIGIDQHPFLDQQATSVRIKRSKEMDADFSRFSEVDDAQTLAGSILFRMQTEIPGFRLRRIRTFTSLEKKPMTSIFESSDSKNLQALESIERQQVHGIIEFDTGPNTPVKWYVHIDESVGLYDSLLAASDVREVLSPANVAKKPWWLRKIFANGFQGLLIKGSMSIFRDGNYLFQYKSPAEDVLLYLKEHGGVVVDGDGIPSPIRYNTKSGRYQGLQNWSHVYRTDITGFGYGLVTFEEF